VLAGTNENFYPIRQPDIHARTKTYHTYSLAPSHGIPHGLPAQYAPRDPAGDLLENDLPALGGNVDDILLIFL
jgi:hypothetical protein